MPSKLIALLRSRKFWAAAIGLALTVLRGVLPDFPISDELLGQVILLLVAYIGGVALEDGLSARKTA